MIRVFSILVAMFFITTFCAGCRQSKMDHQFKPKTKEAPLKWGHFDQAAFGLLEESNQPVLIYLDDLDLLPKSIDEKFYVEHKFDNSLNIEFQRFVHRHKVKLFEFSFSLDQPVEKQGESEELAYRFNDVLRQQSCNVDGMVLLTPPFVLALPNSSKFIYFERPVDARDIMAAVISNGKITDGEEFLFHEIQKVE